jgi:hypothetical protein
MWMTPLLRRTTGLFAGLRLYYTLGVAQYLDKAHHFLISLVCAECLLILTSSNKLTTILKSPAQRSAGEKKQIAGGLRREFFGEFVIFVPVSVFLASVVLRPLMGSLSAIPQLAQDGLLGVVSYGFPYKTIKAWVVRACIRFLKEAISVADKQVVQDSVEVNDLEPPR